MTNTYGSFLIAMFIASSACLASTQSQPSVAVITGEIRNPTSREITFSHESPSALESSEQRVVLDSLNRFAFELPVVRGTLLFGHYKDAQPPRWEWLEMLRASVFGPRGLFVFFVEPGDSLRVVVDEGYFSSSSEFSGQSADNCRFIAEILPEYLAFDLDYEGLEVEDFSRRVEQRRRDGFERLAAGRKKYALSPGFIDYATALLNYGWAEEMISYPMYYRAFNGHWNKHIPPEYFDFLEEIPLVAEKAIGVRDYRKFLDRTLHWESNEGFRPRYPKLSEMYDLVELGLADSVQTRLDSLYEKDGQRPSLSKMVNLSGLGLADSVQTYLDSLYEKDGRQLVLSEKYDLSSLGVSSAAQAQLDSMYEHRQPLKLSAKINLSGLGLSAATQAQLDSLYAEIGSRISLGVWRPYDLAKQKLEGRVLYWYLAGELIDGFERGQAFAFAHRKWEEFQEINPYPEYTEAVQAALAEALKLQPGQPAPDFTLHDLDGQPVSLSQFKGQVVLIDFWASWCGPCIGNLPDLRKIKEKTADRPVTFLNVSLDADEADWREAVAEHEIKGVHVRAAGWGEDVAKSYQVNSLPSYYLVDSQGLIVERLSGVWDTDGIVATIERSL